MKKKREVNNYILLFKVGFICRHKKTVLEIEFQKFNSRLNIFAVYQS